MLPAGILDKFPPCINFFHSIVNRLGRAVVFPVNYTFTAILMTNHQQTNNMNDSTLEKEVLNLLQNRRYDPNTLPRLEEFVNHQVKNQFTDPEANLAVLKLYQFYPQKYNAAIVTKVLIKALMNLPSNDFLCALYLIPERRQVDEPIPVISRLASLLEAGKYVEFWAESGACADLLTSVPGSLTSIRQLMFDVTARTYHKIEMSNLKKIVNLEEDELRKSLSEKGWSIDGETVTCPHTDDNQPRPRTGDEQLNFRQVAAKMLF